MRLPRTQRAACSGSIPLLPRSGQAVRAFLSYLASIPVLDQANLEETIHGISIKTYTYRVAYGNNPALLSNIYKPACL
jgi:hypothetical protein